MQWLTSALLVVVVSLAFVTNGHAEQHGRRPSKLPTVAIIATGGTIAEKTDPKSGAAVPAISGKELVAAVPRLAKLANLQVVDFSNIDSSQMTPELWAGLSKTVDKVLAKKGVVGAVVTHGTDTMAEGSYFLDVTVRSNKPIVFTGAMNNASSPNPDGPANLYNAVVQAISPKAQGWGVTVTMDRYINAADTVRKVQTTSVQSFQSGEKGYLGYIYGTDVKRINDRLHRIRIPLPVQLPKELPKVPMLATFAGDDGSLVRAAIESGAEGLVIQAVGAGNVNADVSRAIDEAIAKKLPVVITTRVYYGAVEPIYGDVGGGATLQNAGAILAGSLDAPKARLLLTIALLRYGNDLPKIRPIFARVRGAG